MLVINLLLIGSRSKINAFGYFLLLFIFLFLFEAPTDFLLFFDEGTILLAGMIFSRLLYQYFATKLTPVDA